VLAQGPRTPDLGGKASATDIGQAIATLVSAEREPAAIRG
jgi:hypothetical protein